MARRLERRFGLARLVKLLQAMAVMLVAGGVSLVVAALPASAAVGSLTLSPSTGVSDGTVLTVTGSGFTHGSLGNLLECNSDPGQPTVALPAPISTTISVGCSPPSFSKIVSTSSTGTISTTWTVLGPTVGPPCGPAPDIVTCPTTDSAGNPPAMDAAKYPCPPTAAQQAAGDVCQLNYGDAANDSATATIGFPTTTTTTSSGSTTTTGGTTTTGATTTTTTGTTSLTGPYEIYCPGTPIGSIAINNVTTQASLTPSSPTSGQTFNVTGYQTSVTLPASLASAAAALSPTLTGSATTKLDALGATPSTLPVGPLTFSLTFPSPIPSSGVVLQVPTPAASEGPFTSSGGGVTIEEDSGISLTLMVAGSPLNLTCTAYPNDTITPSGVTTSTPSVPSTSPVIAVSGGTTTTTTSSPTTTTTSATTTTTGATTTTSGVTTTTSTGGVTSTSEANECSSQTGSGDDHCQPPGCPASNQGQGDDHDHGDDNGGQAAGHDNGDDNGGQAAGHDNGDDNGGQNSDHNNGDDNQNKSNGNGESSRGQSHDQNQGHENGWSPGHSNDGGGSDASNAGQGHLTDVSFVRPQVAGSSNSWGLALGAALVVLGMLMLTLVDFPRRVVARLSMLGGLSRRPQAANEATPEPVRSQVQAEQVQGLWHLENPALWLRPPQE